MPFNNYSPTYVFKGQVQSDTAPSNNNDLVRKQDVSGLSFISSIAAGSSSYLSVSGGELSVSSLLISDVHVDNSQTSLANFISNEGSTAANLKKGDFLVLTAATGGAETFIVSGANGSAANNYTEVESGLTSAEIVAKLSAGAGISISAGGQISSTITQYTDSNARAALTGGAGITYNAGTGQITSSITQYTDSNARAAISAPSGSGLNYNSANGQVSVNNDFFRKVFQNQSLTAGVAKSINHDLGEKFVHVSVYDSNDDLIHAAVSLTDNDNLTITSSDALTGVTVVVSI